MKFEKIYSTDPLELLRLVDGYYEQPATGGPLVGYAGRYDGDKQYVGKIYVNFAKAERNGQILKHIASRLRDRLINHPATNNGVIDCFCGAPEGGKALAAALAQSLEDGYIFPEKEILALKTSGGREKSHLIWGRHEPLPNERVVIVEDVCNNFSTTRDLFELIEGRGAKVIAIACFLNRSLDVDDVFAMYGNCIPVIPLVRKPIMEYRQDHEEVSREVAAGNVVWKPKNEWEKLKLAMESAK